MPSKPARAFACNLVRLRPQTHHDFDQSAANCWIDLNLTRDLRGFSSVRLAHDLARPLHDRGRRSRCHQTWRVEIAGAPDSRHRGSILLPIPCGRVAKARRKHGGPARQPLQHSDWESSLPPVGVWRDTRNEGYWTTVNE